MSYVSITDEDKKMMLDSIGVNNIDDLFMDIPDSIILKKTLKLPEKKTEMEISQHIKNISSNNKSITSLVGAGLYNHYVPAAVDELTGRSEFYTAYTPYQPEVSQGTLTAIFEFQTMISELTGMEIANAGMYDGATALAESVLMVLKAKRKNSVLVSKTIHPNYLEVLKTYCWATGVKIDYIEIENGLTDSQSIKNLITEDTGAIVIQNPNFFGSIEDLKNISDIVHEKGSQLIVSVNEMLSLGILKSPGFAGADVVCGEAQSFGNYVGFGGPLLGFIAVNKEYMRKLPGRLVGRSIDLDGNEAYTLTLQSREQHIRRERATSNICTNEGLVALRSVVYLSLIGNRLKELAMYNHNLAGYLRKKLLEKGFTSVFDNPYFNEFVVRHDNCNKIYDRLKKEGIILGIKLGDYFEEYKDLLLICTTEITGKVIIDKLISIL